MWETKGNRSKSCERLIWVKHKQLSAVVNWSRSSRSTNPLKIVCFWYTKVHALSQVPLLTICSKNLFSHFLMSKLISNNTGKVAYNLSYSSVLVTLGVVLSHWKRFFSSQPLTAWEILSEIKCLLTEEVSAFRGLSQSQNPYWRSNLFHEIQPMPRIYITWIRKKCNVKRKPLVCSLVRIFCLL